VALVYLFVSHGIWREAIAADVGDCLLLLAITLVGSILNYRLLAAAHKRWAISTQAAT